MIIRRIGLDSSNDSIHANLMGASRVLVFRYDVEQMRFSRVSGEEQAFLGYSRVEWLSTSFLENSLIAGDRMRIQALMAACGSGDPVVSNCGFVTADGSDVSAMLAGATSEQAPYEICGQIVMMEPGTVIGRRDEVSRSIDVPLLRAVLNKFTEQRQEMHSTAELMGRHLSTLDDDIGGQHVLRVRECIANMDSTLDLLRLLTQNSTSANDVEEAIATLQAPG